MPNTLEHGITLWVFVDWDKLKGIVAYEKRTGREVFDVIEDRLLRLKYVTETCFNHQSWFKVDVETGDFAVAQRRLADVKAKALRILEAYGYGEGANA